MEAIMESWVDELKLDFGIDLKKDDEQSYETGVCPVCGGETEIIGHCATCPNCGWSKCEL